MKSKTQPDSRRVDVIARIVAGVAVIVLVGAIGLSLSLANAPQPPAPTPSPVSTLAAAKMTTTQAAALTASANDHIMAVTLAAVMQVTPGAVSTGINPAGAPPAPESADDFVEQNVWVGLVADEWASVYAGALRSNPQTGALLLIIVSDQGMEQETFQLALSGGALHFTAENVERLTLVSANGTTYYFDVLAKRFVGTLREYAETATPRGGTPPATATETAQP